MVKGGEETLLSYVPGFLFDQLCKKGDAEIKPPEVNPFPTVALFADVSGFTSLSEKMSLKGIEGAEELSKHLNNYLAQMIKRISKNGGDICKFAGDAIIVLWPLEETMDIRCLRAAQGALEIHECLDQLVLGDGISLRCKIGIGAGNVDILHIGGVTDSFVTQRMEYVALGEALVQSFHAENHASPALTIISDVVVKLLGETCAYTEITGCTSSFCNIQGNNSFNCRFRRLEKVLVPIRNKALQANVLRISQMNSNPQIQTNIWKFVALAVAPFLDDENETWGNELRRVSTMFMNLGISMEYLNSAASINKEACRKLQSVFAAIQKEIFQKEGTINKFLVDDKGTTLVAAFGLSPLAHENDATRAVMSSLALYSEVKRKFDLNLSIGITTGMVFAGVVGHRGHRREYSLLADGVNLAARLMQEASKRKVGILVDNATRLSVGSLISFSFPQDIKVKGKSLPVIVYQPLPPTEVLSQMFIKKSKQRVVSRNEALISRKLLLNQIVSSTNILGTTLPSTYEHPSLSLRADTSSISLDSFDLVQSGDRLASPKNLSDMQAISGLIWHAYESTEIEKSQEKRMTQKKHMKKSSFITGSKAINLAESIEKRRSSLLVERRESLLKFAQEMEASNTDKNNNLDNDKRTGSRKSIISVAQGRPTSTIIHNDNDIDSSVFSSDYDSLFEDSPKKRTNASPFRKANSKAGEVSTTTGSKSNSHIIAVQLKFPNISAEITIPIANDSITVEEVKTKGLLYLKRKGYSDMNDPSHYDIFIEEEWPLNPSTPLDRLWSISLESKAILQMIVKEKPRTLISVKSASANAFKLWPSPSAVGEKTPQEKVRSFRQEYLNTGQGCCMLLQGGIGTGKTFILEKELINSKDLLAVDVVLARGNPFLKGEMNTPYHVWRILLTGLIENDFNRGYCDSTLSLPEAARERVMAYIEYLSGNEKEGRKVDEKDKSRTEKDNRKQKFNTARSLFSGLSPKVILRMPYLFKLLLQDNIDLDMSKEVYQKNIEEEHHNLTALIIETLNAFAGESPIVCVIDDLQHVDLKSWDVCVAIAQSNVNILLALSCRPFGFYVGGMEEPEQYSKLLECTDLKIIAMCLLDAESSEKIACDVFKCSSVDFKVKELIMEKTEGNPLFIKEYCEALKEGEIVSVDILDKHPEARFNQKSIRKLSSPRKSGFSETIKNIHLRGFSSNAKELKKTSSVEDMKVFDKHIDNIVPGTVQGIIASCVDRLQVSQRVILKVAAIIGDVFTTAELTHVAMDIGLKDPNFVKNCLEELKDKGIFKELPMDGRNGVSKRDSHNFTQPFMRDAIRISLLSNQKTMIQKSLATYKEIQEVRHIRDFERTLNKKEITVFKDGMVSIRKFRGFFSHWKNRKATLYRDEIHIAKEGGSLVGTISLLGSKCYLASVKDAHEHNKKYGIVFCIESSKWTKKGKEYNFLRTFFYAAEDVNEASDWVNKIHIRIVNLRSSVIRRKSSQDSKGRLSDAGPLSAGRNGSFSAPNLIRIESNTSSSNKSLGNGAVEAKLSSGDNRINRSLTEFSTKSSNFISFGSESRLSNVSTEGRNEIKLKNEVAIAPPEYLVKGRMSELLQVINDDDAFSPASSTRSLNFRGGSTDSEDLITVWRNSSNDKIENKNDNGKVIIERRPSARDKIESERERRPSERERRPSEIAGKIGKELLSAAL